MKYLFSLILLLAMNFYMSCNKPLKNELKNDKIILVSFKINDEEIIIKDAFDIFFIDNKDTVKSIVKGNEILVLDLQPNKEYSIIFIYEKYKLSFSKITYNMIFPQQNLELDFGIEYPPFVQTRGLLTAKEYEDKVQYNQLQYLQFDVLEYGNGIQFVNKI